MYKRSQVSLVTIQYAGGEIGFDKNWFTQQEIELFQKEIRLAKDKAIEASENAVADKLQEAVSNIAQPAPSSDSKADELSKLADLLQRGVITQEEFEKMKKELI
jgi:multidrug resistance efflux pump